MKKLPTTGKEEKDGFFEFFEEQIDIIKIYICIDIYIYVYIYIKHR